MNTNWTDSARETLDRYLAAHRAACAATGADADEVAADLRARVEEELAKAGLSLVNQTDVERVLARLGPPPVTPATIRPLPSLEMGWFGKATLVFLGILVPAAALLLELVTHIWSEVFFDPIPTWFHVLAIALVPAANAYALFAWKKGGSSRMRRAAWLNAITFGVTSFYAVCFLPVVPYAAVAILAFGLGLLPLSPLASIFAALKLWHLLRLRAGHEGVMLPGIATGWVAAVALLIAVEIPGALTIWAVYRIHDGTTQQMASAVRVLRVIGSEDRLLAGSYSEVWRSGEGRRRLLEALLGASTTENYQLAYYRVTGRAYNSVPAPRRSGALNTMRGRGDTDEWIWDDSLGAARVGQRLKALYLVESRLDGHVDGDAALGYLEWTLVFRNDHQFQQREARAVVQLPPGAVVSRLTLWIDGEEREAAFGGGGEVRAAYQQVAVRQRRDPVLVTHHGPDQVLVQCFPIQPGGGQMKVRLGISVPLVTDRPDAARLLLPRIVEQNFTPLAELKHAVWIESWQPLAAVGLNARDEPAPGGAHALRAGVAHAGFNSPGLGVTVQRAPGAGAVRAVFPRIAEGVFTQEFHPRPAATGTLAIVLDGSAGLAPTAAALAALLEKLPAGQSPPVLVAGDEVEAAPEGNPQATAAWLRARTFRGGHDSGAALAKAFDHVLSRGGGAILWLHGAQPVTWLGREALEQDFARRPGQVKVLAFPAVDGPNALRDALADKPDLVPVARLGSLGDDIARVLRERRGGDPVAVRALLPAGAAGPTGAKELNADFGGHLARLWAADEVTRLRDTGPANRAGAVALAVRAQLVTPVSGAVVLETKQQYDAAGLQPVDPATTPSVPVVPEPATVALIAGAVALVAAFLRRRTRVAP